MLCVKAVSQDYKSVHDGVEYAELTREISGKQVKMNLLRLDLKKVRLDVQHAMDRAIGTETTSSIAKRHGAVAAINAGFFRLDKSDWAGDSVGFVVIDGDLISESINSRIALIIDDTLVDIDHFDVFPRVYPRNIRMPEINGINRERKKGEIVLYSHLFGKTTLTDPKGTEIIFTDCKRTICRKLTLFENAGNSPIPLNGYVLSIDSERNEQQNDLISGMKSASEETNKKWWVEIQPAANRDLSWIFERRGSKGADAVSGVPQLIKNGKIDITWEQEKASKSFVETRHPRTAVAKLKDGKFLMLTVDGRSAESAGIDLYDLAKLLLEFGATDAMNLDGGGSTTMFLDGKVVNKPSDPTGERKVGDAILVTLRKPKRK